MTQSQKISEASLFSWASFQKIINAKNNTAEVSKWVSWKKNKIRSSSWIHMFRVCRGWSFSRTQRCFMVDMFSWSDSVWLHSLALFSTWIEPDSRYVLARSPSMLKLRLVTWKHCRSSVHREKLWKVEPLKCKRAQKLPEAFSVWGMAVITVWLSYVP